MATVKLLRRDDRTVNQTVGKIDAGGVAVGAGLFGGVVGEGSAADFSGDAMNDDLRSVVDHRCLLTLQLNHYYIATKRVGIGSDC